MVAERTENELDFDLMRRHACRYRTNLFIPKLVQAA
jgi:hypothetical protein